METTLIKPNCKPPDSERSIELVFELAKLMGHGRFEPTLRFFRYLYETGQFDNDGLGN